QIDRLNRIKAERNPEKVKEALQKLTQAAKNSVALGDGSETDSGDSRFRRNLLALAVESARERATLGEISDALESVFGRYKAQIKSFSGVYSREIKKDPSFEKAREMADRFAE